MIDLDSECPPTTDGEIAVINLQSARLRSWSRFFQDPLQPGVAETLIEQEQFTAQFVGDLSALDRVESLTRQLVQVDAGSARTALIQAQVASMLHRFSDARHYLAQAELGGAPSAADVKRLRLSIDQACGLNLGAVMDERRKIAAKSGRLEDLVALGALLADLREFSEADRIYRQALRSYSRRFAIRRGVGLLSARRALGRARVRTGSGRCRAVVPESDRLPARLCEGARAPGRNLFKRWPDRRRGRPAGSRACERRSGGALAAGRRAGCRKEGIAKPMCNWMPRDRGSRRFWSGTCWHSPIMARNSMPAAAMMPVRALELARINVDNRPTLRAFEQAYEIAVAAGETAAAAEILAACTNRWGHTPAFRLSSLAQHRLNNREGVAA